MSRYPLRTVVLSAAAVVLVGCKAKDATQPPATAAHILRVTTSDYAFDAPDTIQAGLTTIRLVNHGPSLHHIQLVKLDQGKTLPDFLQAMKGEGPPPPWATMDGGPNAAIPGDSTTAIVQLEPGNYAMICLIPAADGMPHFTKGMAHTLTVTSPPVAVAAPVAEDTVKLVDYSFQFSRPLTAGHHTILVQNAGQQWHELVLVRMNPGKTGMDFATWAQKMTGPPPGEIHGGITGILPGAQEFMVTDLVPGDYALMCFFPDMKDGKPHLAHGMVTMIKVL